VTLHIDGPAAIASHVGATLGPTGWMSVEQARIDQFADATGDHQWIHVDTERAKAGPFGGTIAHGYLTLSLVNLFLPDLVTVDNTSMGVNVGLGKVRFPAPVPAGSRVRGRGEIVSADPVGEGVQVVVTVTVEVDGSDKPACVAETISRFFP